MEEPEKQGLLHGTRILDLANETASFCSRVLADLGALVIKVEKPGGDNSRKIGPFLGNARAPETSLFFTYNNANKLGITLDIEKSDGRQLFFRLIRTADVVVETFPVGYLERIGCPFEVMRGVNPGIILASVTGFGQTGPRSNWKSCDLVASAFGGQMYVSGSPSTSPLRPYGEQSFYGTSLFAAVGILLALIRRRDTGTGAHIDVSSQEAVAATLDHVLVRYLYDGIVAKRQGNLFWNFSSFIVSCKDGFMHINIGGQWETLVEWMAAEGMVEDLREEKWRDEDYRSQHIDHIIKVIETWTRGCGTGELFEIAQAMRLPWAPVSRPEDVPRSPQLRARRFFSEADHPRAKGTNAYPGMPYRFGGASSNPMKRAPLPGEDNAKVYREDIGLSRAEMERLSRSGVIRGFLGARGQTSQGCGGKEGLMADRVLKGARVLDFTWVLAGPYATRILADFGAEVVKVQSLKTAKGPESNLTGYFSMWNRNKRSITLDMSHPEAIDLVLKLAAISDVVIENFSPRVMANWGLTYERLKEVNPRVIMVSMSAMGQTGPWRDYVAFGPGLHALAGLTGLTSFDDEHPLGLGYAYGDHVIGLYGALAVLAALENRSKTDQGRYIDLSGYEAICSCMGPAMLDVSLNQSPVTPQGNRSDHIDAAPSGCYPCRGRDRWCVISVSTDDEWFALCTVLGRPDILNDDRLRTLSGRRSHEVHLDGLIGQWTIERTPEEIVDLLQQAGVPAGVVQSAEDLVGDPHLSARRFFVPLEHPAFGLTLNDRPPIRFEDDETVDWKAAPQLGEDNRYVFRELLGLSEEEFLDYIEQGVIY